MRAILLAVCVGVLALGSITAAAQDTQVDPLDVQDLLRVFDANGGTESPNVVRDDNGYITFMSAPSGGEFATPTSISKSTANATDVARDFLTRHQGAVTSKSAAQNFQFTRERPRGDHTYVHMKQLYGGMDVFGAGAMVQVNADGGVDAATIDIMRQTATLDSGTLSLTPTLTAQAASAAAIAYLPELYDDGVEDTSTNEPVLVVYRPSVVGNTGATRLTWSVQVSGTSAGLPIREQMLVDAHSGDVVLNYSLIHRAKNRQIYDAMGNFFRPFFPARLEGSPASGDIEVDNTYDYLGDTYDFYLAEHDRDSFDDLGSVMVATANFGPLGSFEAFWDFTRLEMFLSPTLTADDVIAHELTHGVTQFESGLIYFGESGAINESFSDIWGEFVDLTNGAGNDSPEVRWLQGEDVVVSGGAIRDMAFPTNFGHPDRYESPFFFNGFADNGGVHINSGVGNKLAYLLTDGDFFNGFFINGMGIPAVADLFYETQLMLTNSSNYFEMALVMSQAASNLGLSAAERTNVTRALLAVEILVIPPGSIRSVIAIPTRDTSGNPLVTVQWDHISGTPDEIGTIVRNDSRFPLSPTDGVQLDLFNLRFAGPGRQGVVDGKRDSLIVGDGSLVMGEDYYYAVFSDYGTFYSRAVAGDDPPSFQTEQFSRSASSPIDLTSSQILFSPVQDGEAARDSGKPEDYAGYQDYTATITQGIVDFPVQRNDENGGGVTLTMPDDGSVFVSLRVPIPYFGTFYNSFAVAGNGYIEFGEFCLDCPGNFPSLSAHGFSPRISFLFADLLALSTGQIWHKAVEDRYVLTFEGVAEQLPFINPVASPNSVQVELFYSGDIRITYKEVNVDDAVVGLSQGKGAVSSLVFLVPDVAPDADIRPTNFSNLPQGNPDALTIWPPIPAQFAIEGETISFDVQTNSPNEVPRLSAEWSRFETVPFADNGDGTGTFLWQTDPNSSGSHFVELRATTLSGEIATTVVSLNVGNFNSQPEARALSLQTGLRGEDVTADREVPPFLDLTAGYQYFNPDTAFNPFSSAEGPTQLIWFRNGGAITALRESPTVPASATVTGDVWWFGVRPITVLGVVGELALSPKVTILANPIITNIAPRVGSLLGGTRVRISGSLLSDPLSVTFNGVPGADLFSLGDEELEVTAPAGAPGFAAVSVTTINGETTVSNLFSFGSTASTKASADVNGDGVVNAVDIQLVVGAVLGSQKGVLADVNDDGQVSVLDVQVVVNVALSP